LAAGFKFLGTISPPGVAPLENPGSSTGKSAHECLREAHERMQPIILSRMHPPRTGIVLRAQFSLLGARFARTGRALSNRSAVVFAGWACQYAALHTLHAGMVARRLCVVCSRASASIDRSRERGYICTCISYIFVYT
jgi:hypothetical protein